MKLDRMMDKIVERDKEENDFNTRLDDGDENCKKTRLNLQAVLEPCNQCGKTFIKGL